MLHITNGHSVGIPLTGIPGEVLYWVDVLHEGPVPAGGDGVIWSYIERMLACEVPLIVKTRELLAMTRAGEDVLLGRLDAIDLNGIDRWLGGVHLEGPDAAWRWNDERRKLARRDVSGAHRR